MKATPAHDGQDRDAPKGGGAAEARGDSAHRDHGRVPEVSPAALVGIALRPVPPAVIRPLAGMAARAVLRRHAGVHDRLAALGEAAVFVDPTDLPFAFVIRPGGRAPRVDVMRGSEPPAAVSATLRGPLALLVDLLEGRLDGDALFFSRELAVEGDAEVVVTLRNAAESAEIRLVDDVLAALGPLAGPAASLHRAALAVLERAAGDIGALRAALARPMTARMDGLAARIAALEADLAALGGRDRPGRGERPARRVSKLETR